MSLFLFFIGCGGESSIQENISSMNDGSVSVQPETSTNNTTTPDDATTNDAPNQVPTLAFSKSSDQYSFVKDEPFMIEIDATDSDGKIVAVDLMLNGMPLRPETIYPYTWNSTNESSMKSLEPGIHTLTGTVTDNKGATNTATILLVMNESNCT